MLGSRTVDQRGKGGKTEYMSALTHACILGCGDLSERPSAARTVKPEVHSPIHSFNKYLLRASHVPSTTLEAGDTAGTQSRQKSLISQSLLSGPLLPPQL